MNGEKEQAVCIGIWTGQSAKEQAAAESALQELAELAEAAGAQVTGLMLQHRHRPDSATYIGKGKLAEIKEMHAQSMVSLVICDDELSGSQMRNISQETDCRVIDRSMLILDIFALRANTHEGKIQVEMAQLQYQLSHLTGQGTAMSRLGGGIGTRGPGESQLETDRRHINRKIASLRKSLAKISHNRDVLRKKRNEDALPVIAVVGYTNAGKSTIINELCQSDLLMADQVFATLDPSVRRLSSDEQVIALLVDTIGFVRKLPHHLIEAFRATLDEVRQADALIHVLDASDLDIETHMTVVHELLAELKAADKDRLIVLNKIDRLPPEEKNSLLALAAKKQQPGQTTLAISAVTGEGMARLRDEIKKISRSRQMSIHLLIPYHETAWLNYIREHGLLEHVQYLSEGIEANGYIPPQHFAPLRSFVKHNLTD